MKFKILTAAAAAAAMVFAAVPMAYALTLEYDNNIVEYTGSVFDLYVNDKKMTDLPLAPIIFNDRAVVPVREIFEELGAEVSYGADTKCVEVSYNNTYIRMYINNNMAYVNGEKTAIPDNVVPKLITNVGGETKTMVPLRFISETVGLNVDFVSSEGAIYVDNMSPAEEPEVTEEPVMTEVPEGTAESDEVLPPAKAPEPTKPPMAQKASLDKAQTIPEEDIGYAARPSARPSAASSSGGEEGITGATKQTKFVMIGADVSHWKGTIDWAKAKNEIDFAILSLGYGQDITSQDDRTFARNAQECKKYGIPFGAYIYSYADTVEKAAGEAEHALRVLRGYDLSFPVYYDLEDDSQTKLSAETLGKIAKTFCDRISAAGYEVGIYANTTWWTNRLTDSAFNDPAWYKWVAQYNTKCTYSGKYTMWQYTDSGAVTGIEGGVDMNYWYGKWRD